MGNLLRAVEILKAGGLVAIPTETVYGLAADASQDMAIATVLARKGRTSDQALPLLLPASAQLEDFAQNIPELAYRLQAAFWPGPLTLVLPKAPWISPLITSHKTSVALRMPAHPLTQELLTFFPKGLIGTSANLSGQPAANSAAEVPAGLADFILDGGSSLLGQASTIVDLTQDPPKILRAGALSANKIFSV